MSRSKSFDETEVLEQAMTLFWRQGFKATSIQDLVAHTGIQRGSLYATFGDKRRLFLTSLDHYRDVVAGRRLLRLSAPGSGKAALGKFFQDVVEYSLGDGRRLGCLLTNSAVELAPHDPVMAERCAAGIGRTEKAFVTALTRARDAGEIDAGRDIEALARFLTSSLQGLRVTARLQPERERLEDVVATTLRALD